MIDPAFVALSLLPVHTWKDVGERLRAGDTAAAALDAIAAARWPAEPGKPSALMERARLALLRGARQRLRPTSWNDPDYPPMLAAIVDPPPVLWTRGALDALRVPAVAIVGSRAASPYALEVAERLGTDLAARGVAVVSGLARGVDSAAHRGALSAGWTIAVLGCGADIVYPAEHAPLSQAIEARGLIVSELAPGTPPLPRFFPQRNRIISGLSRAVVVVEAGERSGSLITARSALDQGRDVLAVPGNVLSGRNKGGHALLRDGATIVETADDILDELFGGYAWAGGAGPRAAGSTRPPAQVSDPVLRALTPGDACDVDAISERSGLAVTRVLPRLLELELEGAVARVGGGRFVRIDRTC